MNQVSLVGRITKDIELKTLSNDREYANFTLAVDRNYRSSNGEIGTDFILCSMWGLTAKNTSQHCGKGSLIGLTGRIQSRYYDKENQPRVYVTEVVASQIRFLSTKQKQVGASSEEESNFQFPAQSSTQLPIT